MKFAGLAIIVDNSWRNVLVAKTIKRGVFCCTKYSTCCDSFSKFPDSVVQKLKKVGKLH